MQEPSTADADVGDGARLTRAIAVVDRLVQNVETVVIGKREQIRIVVTALACRGHVLLEDVPGTAKTVLARAFLRKPKVVLI